jgi:hypothetical protein
VADRVDTKRGSGLSPRLGCKRLILVQVTGFGLIAAAALVSSFAGLGLVVGLPGLMLAYGLYRLTSRSAGRAQTWTDGTEQDVDELLERLGVRTMALSPVRRRAPRA